MMANSTDLRQLSAGTLYAGSPSYPELAGFWGSLWDGIKKVGGVVLTGAAAAVGASLGIPPALTVAAVSAVRAAVSARGGTAGPMTVIIDGVQYDLSGDQVAAMAGDAVEREDTIAGIPTTYVLIAAGVVVLYVVLRK